MATGQITLDTGSTLNTTTYTISEDAVTKHIPRSVLNNSSGAEIGINGAPIIAALSGGTLASLGSITGAVTITGSTTIVGTITITGSTSVVNTVAVTGNTTILGTVTITGSTTIQGTATITGSTSVINTVNITGSTTIVGIVPVSGTVTITGSTSVINTVAITGSTTIVGTVTITGSTTLVGTSTITGSTSVVNTVSDNLIQIGSNAVNTGSGISSAGTLRVVQANDHGKSFLSTTGTLSATNGTLVISASGLKIKVYAISLTTTSSTQQLVKFQTAVGGTDLWTIGLMAAPSMSTGANLAVAPPAYLFATPTTSVLNLNQTGTNAVHYSVSYFLEA